MIHGKGDVTVSLSNDSTLKLKDVRHRNTHIFVIHDLIVYSSILICMHICVCIYCINNNLLSYVYDYKIIIIMNLIIIIMSV